jgi:hypothetical protein
MYSVHVMEDQNGFLHNFPNSDLIFPSFTISFRHFCPYLFKFAIQVRTAALKLS